MGYPALWRPSAPRWRPPQLLVEKNTDSAAPGILGEPFFFPSLLAGPEQHPVLFDCGQGMCLSHKPPGCGSLGTWVRGDRLSHRPPPIMSAAGPKQTVFTGLRHSRHHLFPPRICAPAEVPASDPMARVEPGRRPRLYSRFQPSFAAPPSPSRGSLAHLFDGIWTTGEGCRGAIVRDSGRRLLR